jgi:hypothetical protein
MGLGDVIVVPVVSPASAGELTRLAAALAAPDGGRVVPVTVVGLDASAAREQDARALVDAAAAQARAAGAASAGVVLRDRSVVAAVLRCMADHDATLALMGWQGASTRQNVFGQLIDSIVGRSTIPLAVVRSRETAYGRLVLPVSHDHLLPTGARGLRLAVDVAVRLRGDGDVTILRTGESSEALPRELQALGDRVHHDPRRVDQAVGAVAGRGDMVVVPVAATASGLRTATTHMAWAAPDPWLLIAIDVGPTPAGGAIAEAVSAAGTLPELAREEEVDTDFAIRVTARPHAADDALDGRALEAALRLVGVVEAVDAAGSADRRGAADEHSGAGGRVHRVTVTIRAPSANVAVGAVLTAVHTTPGLEGAEITYDVAT